MLRRLVLPMLLVAAVGCSADDGDSAPSPSATTLTPSDSVLTSTSVVPGLAGRLVEAYPDPDVDPSAAAWLDLLDDPDLAEAPLSVIEFADVADEEARTAYTAYVEAMRGAVDVLGGTFVVVSDVRMPGLELPQGFDGGMVWSATFPSRDALVEAWLDPAVVEAAEGRRRSVIDPHLFVGVNIVPQTILDLPFPPDVEALPHDLVRDRPVDEVIDELLSLYDDGGADPTRATLEAMLGSDDVRTQPLTYVNMYRFGPGKGGAESIGEYNAAALPFVLDHGARPRVIIDVAHQLLGSDRWDRLIIVRWPSMEVFTDLRLTPGYVEAQKSRVDSSKAYGNLITIDRAD